MTKITAELLITLIDERRGNVASVARALGVTRTTTYKHIARYPTVQQALEDARETMLDNAESVLYKKVLEGSTAELIFFLKTQGWRRGWTERVEHSGPGGGPIPITAVDYRNGLAALAPGPVSDSDTSGEDQKLIYGPALGQNGNGRGHSG